MSRLSASVLVLLGGCAPSANTPDAGSAAAVTSPDPAGGAASAPAPAQGWSRLAVGGLSDGWGDTGGAGSEPLSAARGAPGYLDGGALGVYRVRVQVVSGNQYEITLTDTGSGWIERFIFQRPATPLQPAPLLVLFHKFGGSHFDTVFNTQFFTQADSRGWFVVAPLSAATKHFGSSPAQTNTQLVLDFVLQQFGSEIDRDRIYGVGFSMGGGAMLAYAASHVDPDHAMFAALLSHTGGGALVHTYYNTFDDDDSDDNIQTGANLETPDILDFWYDGPPTLHLFTYQRHSVVDIDAFGVVSPDTSLITNLLHVPLHTWYALNDPQTYLIAQSLAIWQEFLDEGGTSVLTQVPGTSHTWHTLDDVATLDWLQQYTLTLPTAGRTRADADGRWFYFDVIQDASGSFTTFDWSVDAQTSTLSVNNTQNLLRISVDLARAGLDPANDLTLNVGSADASGDGTGDEVRFLGVPAAPSLVLRDGTPTANWIHDPATATLTITELDGQAHQWWILAP
jgi:hypothetical protein